MYKAVKVPRPARIEIPSKIFRSFRVIKRTRENVPIPVRRRSAKAAPHTNFPEPCFPNDRLKFFFAKNNFPYARCSPTQPPFCSGECQ